MTWPAARVAFNHNQDMSRLPFSRLAAGFTLAGLLLVGAGCLGCEEVSDTTGGQATASPYQGPDVLSFSLSRLPIAPQRYETLASRLFPTGQLEQNARACGTSKSKDYFTKLAKKFVGQQAVVYSFKYLEPVADNGIFTLIVVPNVPKYRDMAAFRADFNVCVAESRYPKMMNDEWLLFADGCPNVGNWNLPAGCQLMESAILKSVKFKEPAN